MAKKKENNLKPTLDDTVDENIQGLLSEKTEMGEVFQNLDNDAVDPKTNFSKIDFNARLTEWEIPNCMKFDELKALGILPHEANITTQKKRLSVSLRGLGRQEKVTIASASRDADLSGRGGGIWSRIASVFRPSQPQP